MKISNQFRWRVGFAAAMCLALIGCQRATLEGAGDDGSETVTFAIDMAEPVKSGWFDPTTERVGIRGGSPPLSWGRTIEAADPDGDLIFEATVDFDSNSLDVSRVAFKFKVDGEDNPNDGWENGRNRSVDVAATRLVERRFDRDKAPVPRTLTGTIKQHTGFADSVSGLAARDVLVYLPTGYETSGERYPVLYMHDGVNVFDAAEVGNEWRMDEHAEAMIADGRMRPAIIVGIGNTADRMQEYTPSATGGDRYGRFIVDQVKPFVDRMYRTLPGRDDTHLGGSSLGGLITMYLALEYNDVFSGALVVSPSVWWDDRFLLRHVETAEADPQLKIWLDIGGDEGQSMVADVRALSHALNEKDWPQTEVRFVEVEGAVHNEQAWAARADDMLLFLFGAR